MQPVIDWFPRRASIIGAKRARSGYGDEHSFSIFRIEKDCVQTHPACPRLPFWTRVTPTQSGQLVPRLAAVLRFKQRCVFDACINVIGIVKRWFQMPDAFELPRMLCSVVPLVRGERFTGFGGRIVNELVAFGLGHTLGTR